MNGKDGKPFKTRAGGVMRLETLIADVTDYVTSKIKENQTVSDDELPQTAKCIAMAALKYGDLSNMPTKDYVFDLDRFSSFEGNTGPVYPLHHRPDQVDPGQIRQARLAARSCCRAGQRGAEAAHAGAQPHGGRPVVRVPRFRAERDLRVYLRAGDGREQVLSRREDPHRAGRRAKQASYAALIDLTRGVLETCIDLLGFSAPERM